MADAWHALAQQLETGNFDPELSPKVPEATTDAQPDLKPGLPPYYPAKKVGSASAPASCTSSVITENSDNSATPKAVLIAASVASRPTAMSIRPILG